jgi:AmmeMemoRadiSam system protein B
MWGPHARPLRIRRYDGAVSAPLPRLRLNLDFQPSPIEDRPGLLIRDSRNYSDVMLVIPPPLVACLAFFDGEHDELDLKSALARITGELDVSEIQQHFIEMLSRSGFLHDHIYDELREQRHRAFAESPVREPSHAGSAYPAERAELQRTLAGYMNGSAAAMDGDLIGIAAPHVSPFGGVETYRAAYSALSQEHRNRTFIVLGTSHYGEPDRFGITRKAFATPFGQVQTDAVITDRLAKQPAAIVEDYCHSIEHSIEFQVVFLQYLFGADVRVVPVLCGSFARSIYGGGKPEDNEDVCRFFDELGDIAASERSRLTWVLGIDMAHIGPRYGDRLPVRANQGQMLEIAERDRARIDRINAGDAAGFWDLVQQNQDDLKWCGSSPLYTFLKTVPGVRGALREYQHWNIDEESVVSFGALAFTGP